MSQLSFLPKLPFLWSSLIATSNSSSPISAQPVPTKHQSFLLHWNRSYHDNSDIQVVKSDCHICVLIWPYLLAAFDTADHFLFLETLSILAFVTPALQVFPPPFWLQSPLSLFSPLFSMLACFTVQPWDLFSSLCLFYWFKGHLYINDYQICSPNPDLSSELQTLTCIPDCLLRGISNSRCLNQNSECPPSNSFLSKSYLCH